MAQRRVGTSGWSYDHWRGEFYPEELARGEELEHYAMVFDSVELNATFYHLAKPKTAQGWHERTPDDFLFAVKGSRYISHNRKLFDCREPLERFADSVAPLQKKLGPVLWQLSPNLERDLAKLEQFLQLKPTSQCWAWEFRHESWFCDKLYELLEVYNCALVWADTPDYPFEAVVTADFLYARLHGHQRLYASNYSDYQLEQWSLQLLEAADSQRDIFVYFDNDAEGYAPPNALTMRRLLNRD